MSQDSRKTTHFGFEDVDESEKQRMVRGVFDSVATKYDVMNDIMSMGMHRMWKSFTLGQTGLRKGQVALDVAGGTGDLTKGMARQVGSELDEFIVEALRNNLVGLPLDLGALNIARGRETGVPSLNAARAEIYAMSGHVDVKPYTPSATDDDYVFFDMWYPGNQRCRVEITTPSGKTYPTMYGRGPQRTLWETNGQSGGFNLESHPQL